ncbi:MAG: acyl-CoA dehydrogenase family protein [Actinomycetota bacterium]
MSGGLQVQKGRPLSGADILANARALADDIRAEDLAAQYDELRRLPDDLFARVRDTGVLRMNMPRSWGGPEMTSMEQVEVIESLSAADASVGWCSFIWTDSGLYSGYLDDQVGREMYPHLDMATSGWIYPVGTALRLDGGYRVSGNWMFGSGSAHCDWLAAGCLVDDVDSERPIDHWRIVLAPPDDFEILDTWYTTGLRGTGSNDYRATDLFVPEERVFTFFDAKRDGALWRRPDALLRKMAGVPLGVAADALASARTLLETKTDRLVGMPYRNMGRVQAEIATAHGKLGAARAYVFHALERQWAKLESGEPLTVEERVDTWLSRSQAFQTGREVVAQLYDLVGGAAIYSGKGPFDRHLRDMQTACQHLVAQTRGVENAGQVLLGVDDAAHPMI